MTDFNESQHPRAATGEFKSKFAGVTDGGVNLAVDVTAERIVRAKQAIRDIFDAPEFAAVKEHGNPVEVWDAVIDQQPLPTAALRAHQVLSAATRNAMENGGISAAYLQRLERIVETLDSIADEEQHVRSPRDPEPRYTAEEAAEVARVIKAQIGVGALMRTGARDFVYDRDGSFRFDITSQGRKARVTVALTPMDDYTVTLSRKKRGKFEFEHDILEEHDGIYAEDLAGLISSFDRE